jgi:hypothetical protein
MNTIAAAMPQRQNTRTPGFGAEASVYRAGPYYHVARGGSNGHLVVLPAALPPPHPGDDGGGAPGMCRFECNESCFEKMGCNSLSGTAKTQCQNVCIKACDNNCRLWGMGAVSHYTPDVCDANRRIDCTGIEAWETACDASIVGSPLCSSVAKQKRSELECHLCD